MSFIQDLNDKRDGGEFFGVVEDVPSYSMDDEDKDKYMPPRVFVGGDASRKPSLPKKLPAAADPKLFLSELKRTDHTYVKTFKTKKVVAFENWGIFLRDKKTHDGWELKPLDK
jgi:hypothetical protein